MILDAGNLARSYAGFGLVPWPHDLANGGAEARVGPGISATQAFTQSDYTDHWLVICETPCAEPPPTGTSYPIAESMHWHVTFGPQTYWEKLYFSYSLADSTTISFFTYNADPGYEFVQEITNTDGSIMRTVLSPAADSAGNVIYAGDLSFGTTWCYMCSGEAVDTIDIQASLDVGIPGRSAFVDAFDTFGVDITSLDPQYGFISAGGRTIAPVAAVPEPAALFLFGISIAVLAGLKYSSASSGAHWRVSRGLSRR